MLINENNLSFFKVTSLPEPLTPNAMYLVKNNDQLEIHLTDKHGISKVSTLSKEQVNHLILATTATTLAAAKLYSDKVGKDTLEDANAYSTNVGKATLEDANEYTDSEIGKIKKEFDLIKPNSIVVLEAFSNLDPKNKNLHNCFIFVRNAEDDPTVEKGSATYVFDVRDNTFIKVTEHESMDIELEWSSIKNGPSSTPKAIDEAVKKAEHKNIKVLDQLTEGEQQQLLYKGKPVGSNVILQSVEW